MKYNERQNNWFLEFIPYILIPEYGQSSMPLVRAFYLASFPWKIFFLKISRIKGLFWRLQFPFEITRYFWFSVLIWVCLERSHKL